MILSIQDKEEEKREKFKINQFNLLASEMISLNRSLQDVRLSQCKSKVIQIYHLHDSNTIDRLIDWLFGWLID